MLPVSKKFLVLFLIILLSGIKTLGQTKKIDSLRQVLRTAGMDTNRVKALGFLSSLIGANNPDTAIILASQSLLLSKKLKWKKGEAVAELKLGNLNHSISNQKKALFHFNNGLNVCEALLASQNPIDIKYGKKIKGTIIGNIAGVYQAQGNLPKALEYYLNGLKIAEEVGDKHAIGRGFNNLATVFVTQANYPKALKYYFKSLKTAEEFGDKKGIGLILGNIANVYTAQENYPEALEYYFNGLRNSEESGHKIEVGRTLGNIANVFKVQVFSAVSKNDMVFAKTKLYPKALEYYLKSLKLLKKWEINVAPEQRFATWDHYTPLWVNIKKLKVI